MENSMEVPQRTKNRATKWSSNPTPGHISREKHNLKRYRHLMFFAALFTIARHGSNLKVYLQINGYRCGAWVRAKSLQSCPTLCNPIDGSPPGSAAPGIFQERTLEWVAISFSSAWKWNVKVKSLSRVQLFATPWTAAHQAPPSMGFARQEYWSRVPLPSPF